VFLGALASLLVLSPVTHAQALNLAIPPVHTTVTIEKQPVAIAASGTISVVPKGRDQNIIRLAILADLSDFQRNATVLLAAALDKQDKCGDHIDIKNVTLTPAEPGINAVTELHYERWGCAKVMGKQMSTKLVAGNAVMPMRLTPVVENGNAVHLAGDVGTVQADGSLGELLRSGSVGAALQEKIRTSLLSAMEKGSDLSATLPPAVQGYATIQGVRFKDGGAGRLFLAVEGEGHLSREQLHNLQEQLKNRAPSR
jgi:hypothetical protein